MEKEMALNAKTLTISGVFHLVFGAFFRWNGNALFFFSAPFLKNIEKKKWNPKNELIVKLREILAVSWNIVMNYIIMDG